MGGECGVASFLLFSEEAPACPEVGAKQCLVSHLVPAVLGAQSHRTVGGGVWENVWDVEVKTLQDICGLHLPRDGGQAGESWAPHFQPQQAPSPQLQQQEYRAVPTSGGSAPPFIPGSQAYWGASSALLPSL